MQCESPTFLPSTIDTMLPSGLLVLASLLATAYAQSSSSNSSSTASQSASSASSSGSNSTSAADPDTTATISGINVNPTAANSSATSSGGPTSTVLNVATATGSVEDNSLTGNSGYVLVPASASNLSIKLPYGSPNSALLPTVKVINAPVIGFDGSVRAAKGHFITGPDANMFSIYPPIQGCGYGLTTTSAEARYRGCSIAMNFGFFDIGNTTHPHCLGAVVSDGQFIETDTTNTVHFGLTSQNEWFIGYVDDQLLSQHTTNLTDRCDATGPCAPQYGNDWYFKNLASGQVMLVNNGQNFVNASSVNNTNFVELISGRAAIGVLGNGDLGLVQIDGKSGADGIDLFTLADVMVKLGFQYAINMDGGGSSTTALNGVLASNPSDPCPGDTTKLLGCERYVSTIACIHNDPQPYFV